VVTRNTLFYLVLCTRVSYKRYTRCCLGHVPAEPGAGTCARVGGRGRRVLRQHLQYQRQGGLDLLEKIPPPPHTHTPHTRFCTQFYGGGVYTGRSMQRDGRQCGVGFHPLPVNRDTCSLIILTIKIRY